MSDKVRMSHRSKLGMSHSPGLTCMGVWHGLGGDERTRVEPDRSAVRSGDRSLARRRCRRPARPVPAAGVSAAGAVSGGWPIRAGPQGTRTCAEQCHRCCVARPGPGPDAKTQFVEFFGHAWPCHSCPGCGDAVHGYAPGSPCHAAGAATAAAASRPGTRGQSPPSGGTDGCAADCHGNWQ